MTAHAMKTVRLPAGEAVPALGLGTWNMGEKAASRKEEVAALRLGLDLGMRLIDTAEMYGEGGAEAVVGQAVAEALRAGTVAREELFVVSKVYPHNASRAGVAAACESSRQRLGLDRIDLYLLHWRGAHPLSETVAGFEALRSRGHIARWGVSNFDVDDLEELQGVAGGTACAANQVYYSLSERGPGHSLLPWQQRVGMPLMAYCPIDQGVLAGHPRLAEIARAKDCTAAQLAQAWVMQQSGVMAIPKAVREAHLRENFAAAALHLSDDDIAALDTVFPPPRRKPPLAMV